MQLPDFSYERQLWEIGMEHVAGIDEVGRGCFAGPLFAGCVVFPNDLTIRKIEAEEIYINDSKQLKPNQRRSISKWIKANCVTWGVGEVSVSQINRLGMTRATATAFRRALSKAREKSKARIEYLLIDAFYVPYTRDYPISKNIKEIFDFNSRQLAIKKGDAKSISIAAASIIAKVERDKRMLRLSKREKYKIYGWGRNKGYGTKEHRQAIKRYGITKMHRKQFVETYLSRSQAG
jgi:ribonuclease HII